MFIHLSPVSKQIDLYSTWIILIMQNFLFTGDGINFVLLISNAVSILYQEKNPLPLLFINFLSPCGWWHQKFISHMPLKHLTRLLTIVVEPAAVAEEVLALIMVLVPLLLLLKLFFAARLSHLLLLLGLSFSFGIQKDGVMLLLVACFVYLKCHRLPCNCSTTLRFNKMMPPPPTSHPHLASTTALHSY